MSDLAEQPSFRWCGRDDAHAAHERRNQFGGKDYCTGMSEIAASRGQTPPTDPTSTDGQPVVHLGLSMSDLAEQIAREHPMNALGGCVACATGGDRPTIREEVEEYAAHIATVTEQAVRERIENESFLTAIYREALRRLGEDPDEIDAAFYKGLSRSVEEIDVTLTPIYFDRGESDE